MSVLSNLHYDFSQYIHMDEIVAELQYAIEECVSLEHKVERCDGLGTVFPNPFDPKCKEYPQWNLDHLCNDVYSVETGYHYHEITYSIAYHSCFPEELLAFGLVLEKALKEVFPKRDVRVMPGLTTRVTSADRYGRSHFISIAVSHSQYDLE